MKTREEACRSVELHPGHDLPVRAGRDALHLYVDDASIAVICESVKDDGVAEEAGELLLGLDAGDGDVGAGEDGAHEVLRGWDVAVEGH